MLHGKNQIGYTLSARGTVSFQTTNPVSGTKLEGNFTEATEAELNQAVALARKAYHDYKNKSGREKACFLREIASEIELLGNSLIERACAESGLPEGRISGERGRTINQLRLFADLLEEGSWVDAIIDVALPERKPMPRPDIRRMLQPIGPVAIFTASNFPLAFSTAGGDTASALAAGNPVIIKAHPYHAGTNELVAGAIARAARSTGMPEGVFSSLNALGFETGKALVMHADIQSVAFTGSFTGGMSLYRMAQERSEPIPVFAEMGSINPVLLLPEILESSPSETASAMAASVNLGAGQFCTNPGLMLTIQSSGTRKFKALLKEEFMRLNPQTMLHSNIISKFNHETLEILGKTQVEKLAESGTQPGKYQGRPILAGVSGKSFLTQPTLAEEVFGPFSLLIECSDEAELSAVIENLKGQLTATIIGTEADFRNFHTQIETLKGKVGRLIFNGVPTGVEVCEAMQHGGPFPASTDGRFTSVGTEAIKRFVRPVSYQDAPQSFLPEELRDENSLQIWRKVNGSLTKNNLK